MDVPEKPDLPKSDKDVATSLILSQDQWIGIVIGIVAAIILTVKPPTGLLGRSLAADVIVGCIVWLFLTLPSFADWKKTLRFYVAAFSAVVSLFFFLVMVQANGISDEPAPSFSGSISMVISGNMEGVDRYLLGITVLNNTGESYLADWKVYYDNDSGRHYGRIIAGPPQKTPFHIRFKTPDGDSAEFLYRAEDDIERITLETGVKPHLGTNGDMLVIFDGVQPSADQIVVSFQDRDSRTYELHLANGNPKSYQSKGTSAYK